GTATFNTGQIITTSYQIYRSAVTLQTDVSIDASAITFLGTVNGTTAGTEDLTLTASSGDILFDAAVGSLQRLGAVLIDAVINVTFDDAFHAASITQTTGTGATSFNGATTTTLAAGVDITTNAIAFGAARSIS